jgi:hypothetical protein
MSTGMPLPLTFANGDVGPQCIDATKLKFIGRSRPGNEFHSSLATSWLRLGFRPPSEARLQQGPVHVITLTPTQEITHCKWVHQGEAR